MPARRGERPTSQSPRRAKHDRRRHIRQTRRRWPSFGTESSERTQNKYPVLGPTHTYIVSLPKSTKAVPSSRQNNDGDDVLKLKRYMYLLPTPIALLNLAPKLLARLSGRFFQVHLNPKYIYFSYPHFSIRSFPSASAIRSYPVLVLQTPQTRRVVTTRQHFRRPRGLQCAPHKPFLLSLSPPDISKSRVDFSTFQITPG